MSLEHGNKSEEIELDSKKLQVGDKTYYVDMKQNKHGKFMKLVEGLGFGRMSRIVISTVIIQEFLDKLKEMNEFIENNASQYSCNTKSAISGENSTNDFPTIIYSSHLFALFRRFYFDLRQHKDGYRRLRISYVMKKRRINISIVTDAVSSLIQIVEDYANRFLPDEAEKSAAIKGNGTITSKYNRLKYKTFEKDVSQKFVKQGGLVVAETPTPIKQVVSNKNYSFEVVNGEQAAFVRITEYIGTNKKSAFHIPLEGCVSWKDACVNFISKIKPEEITKAYHLRVATDSTASYSKKE